MSDPEKIHISREDTVSRERAVALGHAANEQGVKIIAVANEGESYTTRRKPYVVGGFSEGKPSIVHTGTVPEGQVRVETSGMFPTSGVSELHKRADQIEAELNQRKAA